MLKVKFAVQSRFLLVPYISRNCRWDSCKPLPFFINPFFTESQNRAYTSTPQPNNSANILLVDYLTNSIKLPNTEAVAISKRFPRVSSVEKPEAVVSFFKSLGFSDAQIQLSVKRQPGILFADIEKTIKPKVAFYQELGLCGPHLGTMVSKNPFLLASSLSKTIKPGIEVIKEVLESEKSNNDNNNNFKALMFRILSRYAFVIGKDSVLRSNIAYLRRCGVVGSQLITMLKCEPRLLSIPEEELRNLVSRATEVGFLMGSRMLVYGILALYGNTPETIDRKSKLLRSFGFSQDESNEMFVKSPPMFKTSEAKLRRGIEFFLQTVMLDKSVLVGTPSLLDFSLEKRMIPRYKILEMMKSRGLLEKKPSFVTVAFLTDKKFVEKYILRFGNDDAKELQLAYENHLLQES
ncbi:hypothetical protein ABFS82_12G008600 [Erythranthe guttata]|nr:PREDICTED: uncharacterized protein LOC105973031 [Erythranthe guttata]|eukprot:XP_012853479.1 PREDICTED: uncharacterized protein LOC105973031 [Erythranthe guttata]